MGSSSSERFYLTVIPVLYLGATIWLQNLVGCRDLHQEVACYRDRLRINCGDQSFIAIHEAFFTTHVPDNNTCGPPPGIEHESVLHDDDDDDDDESSSTDPTDVSPPVCYEDIRVSINRRCSGSISCIYSYHEQSDKKCPNMRGQYVVRYDCVRNSSVVKYCNTKLDHREGYFSSPGFPQFYPHLRQCGWTLHSQPGQTIFLKVLHLHLRPPSEVVPTPYDPDSLYALGILGSLKSEEDLKCDVDSLTVSEGKQGSSSVCGEETSGLKTFEVDSGEVEVSFRSAAFHPASGFLMYYKIQGCPVLPVPEGSHLVEGNSSVSVYACDAERSVFNDTQESERYLSCVRDHHWNDTLPPCVPVDEATTTQTIGPNAYTTEELPENGTSPSAERATTEAKETAYLEDILIPSILIGVLLLANAIIIATIFIIKKRQRAKLEEEDEIFEDPKSEPLVPDVKDV